MFAENPGTPYHDGETRQQDELFNADRNARPQSGKRQPVDRATVDEMKPVGRDEAARPIPMTAVEKHACRRTKSQEGEGPLTDPRKRRPGPPAERKTPTPTKRRVRTIGLPA